MTGPEHYREAERLIANAKTANVNRDAAAFYLAQAQVHATLAHAAATAMGTDLHLPDWHAWQAVASGEVTR